MYTNLAILGQAKPAMIIQTNLENQSHDENDSLQQHLMWQIELSALSDLDRLIADSLIDALDDSGYLQEPIENIHENLGKNYGIELDEVEAVLKFIQRLDPIGSGARSLQECLDIQLQQLPEDTPYLTEARLLVERYLDSVATKDYKLLVKLNKTRHRNNRECDFTCANATP